eukprot:3460301-Amphidinium_carterae.1
MFELGCNEDCGLYAEGRDVVSTERLRLVIVKLVNDEFQNSPGCNLALSRLASTEVLEKRPDYDACRLQEMTDDGDGIVLID